MVKQNWHRLAVVQVGLIVGLPAVMVGHLLVTQYGVSGALAGLAGGSVILFALAMIAASLAVRRRLTTSLQTEAFFGRKGMVMCSWAMGMSMFGWFVIQLNLMSDALVGLFADMGASATWLPVAINLGFGGLITLLVVGGIQTIGRFALWNLPLMVLTLAYAVSAVYAPGSLPHDSHEITAAGMPLVVASNLALVVDMSTYYRFASSYRDATVSVFITFLIVIPMVAAVGIALGYFVPGVSMIGAIVRGGGVWWKVWAAAFLASSGCMINNGNLYSCSVAIRPLTGGLGDRTRLFVLGCFGSALACLDLVPRFELLLKGIAILLGSMAAVMLTNYVMDGCETRSYSERLQAWNRVILVAGVAFGLLFAFGTDIRMTGISFVDTGIFASVSTIALRIMLHERSFAR